MAKEKIKTKPEIHTCWKCGTTFVLKYKEKWRREKRAKENNRPVDLDICGDCGKKHYRIYEVKKRYGCEHALQNPESMAKRNQTMINRYGTDVAMHVEEFVERQKATNLERYGYEVSSKNDKVKEKAINTNLERYKVPYTGMVREFQEKRINTLLEKYNTTEVFKIHNPNGSLLEQDFLNKINSYLFENQLPFKIKQEFRTFDKTYDFAIYNPDGTVNCVVECDGYYFHGYKYDNGYEFFDNKKTTSDKKIKRDRNRLFKADYLNYKIFIIRQNKDNTINLDDFNLLTKNLFLDYKEWVDFEIKRINTFYFNALNSIQLYNNFINSMRIKYYGFTPYDIGNDIVKQEEGYLYKDHIGPTPYDIKLGDEYLL